MLRCAKCAKYRRGNGFNTADVVICPLKIRFKLLTIGYLIFVHKEEGKFAAYTRLAVYHACCLDHLARGYAAFQFACKFDGVSWTNGCFEAHVIHSRKEGKSFAELARHHRTRRLRCHFAENDAGNDGGAGKVSLQKEFVAAHGIAPVRFALFVAVCLVHEQHGLAVGQYLFNFVSVHLIHLILCIYLRLQELLPPAR